jgi:hypothetical protein
MTSLRSSFFAGFRTAVWIFKTAFLFLRNKNKEVRNVSKEGRRSFTYIQNVLNDNERLNDKQKKR